MKKTRIALIKSAALLPHVSTEACRLFVQKSPTTACRVSQILEESQNIEDLIGSGNLDLMRDNHINHTNYLATLFKIYDPENFVDTIVWVLKTYQTRGFTLAYWPEMIRAVKIALETELPQSIASEIVVYYDWIQSNLSDLAALSELFPSRDEHE